MRSDPRGQNGSVIETPNPATDQSSDLAARLAYAVGRLNRQLRPLRPELSHGVILALSSVVRHGPVRPSELGRIEGVAAPTATRLIVELERRGLVTREDDPDDGRSFFVRATEAGVEAVVEARRDRAVHAAQLLDGLTEAELSTVVEALGALERMAQIS